MTVKSVRLPAIIVAFATAFASFFASPAWAGTISAIKVANGTSGPWLYRASLNASSQYGAGAQAAPGSDFYAESVFSSTLTVRSSIAKSLKSSMSPGPFFPGMLRSVPIN